MKKLLIILGAVAVAVPLGAFAWMRVQSSEPPPPAGTSTDGTRPVATASSPDATGSDVPARPIAWARVELADGRATRHLSGIVQAGERAPLAFETSGRVETIAVEVGDRFAAGDVLATLNASALELELDEREAALAEAEAARADGRRDFERKRTLYRDGVEAEASYLSAQASLETLDSRVAVARTLIERARDRLADATLAAPFAGSVASRPAEPAEFVAAGAPVLEVLGDAGGHEITVRVPDDLIDRLDADGEHRVRVGRTEPRELPARIVEIGARALSGAAFPVTLRLDESDEPLRAGLVGEVRFALLAGDAALAGALQVPATAVLAGAGDTSHVFAFDEASSVVQRREVRVHGIEGESALMTPLEPDALVEGDIVATRGVAFLTDGQRVALLGVGIAHFDL